MWAIVSITGIVASLAILAIALPSAFLNNGKVHFEITVSHPLAVGLVVLACLLNTYLVGKRMGLRHLREQIISTTLQKQVVEQQSFTDPAPSYLTRTTSSATLSLYRELFCSNIEAALIILDRLAPQRHKLSLRKLLLVEESSCRRVATHW